MQNLSYIKPEKILLQKHPVLNEKWVQARIAEDPGLLGLGDLILKDKERIQPKAGRLDLLLQDSDVNHRYEVEIQLGSTDESHIIRTIEYWDVERRRYPQYEHTAVIVAENVTSRFLNVISLFNGFIPLVAIQMNAVQIGEQISLIFTTVLDQMRLGLVEEDEAVQEVTDRYYWTEKASQKTVSMADQMLAMIHEWDPQLALKYNKFYIGLARDGQPDNFVVFRPKKGWIRLEPRLDRSDELQERLEEEGLDAMDYDTRWGRYRIRLAPHDLAQHEEFLKALLKEAYDAAKH
jgi:hypothetical protein